MSAAEPHGRVRRGWNTRRVLLAVLGLQLGLAVFLAGRDVIAALPQMAWPSSQPQLTTPVVPGDQRRRYAPRDTPLPDAGPGSPERPFRNTADMPQRLEFHREGDVLRATGGIEAGDAKRFQEELAREEGLSRVRLNSPGGSVSDALEIGRGLRAAGLETVMGAEDVCFSACPYVLAGGTVRRVHADAQVGMHQHYFGKSTVLPAFLAVEDIQRGQGAVMTYLDAMGIDTLVMRHALATPPDEIYVLLADEMLDYRLVTEVVE